MNDPQELDLILFDLGGVILNIQYERTQIAFEELGLDPKTTIYSQAAQSEVFDKLETGDISPQEFRDEIRNMLGQELRDAEIDGAWNALLLELPEERLNFILEVKKRFKTALLSNTNEIHVHAFESRLAERDLLDKFKSCFERLYYSSRIGLRKPNAEAFEYVLSAFNTVPSRCLFIDDSLQHIETARAIGMQTLHLQKEEEIAERLAYLIS